MREANRWEMKRVKVREEEKEREREREREREVVRCFVFFFFCIFYLDDFFKGDFNVLVILKYKM